MSATGTMEPSPKMRELMRRLLNPEPWEVAFDRLYREFPAALPPSSRHVVGVYDGSGRELIPRRDLLHGSAMEMNR